MHRAPAVHQHGLARNGFELCDLPRRGPRCRRHPAPLRARRRRPAELHDPAGFRGGDRWPRAVEVDRPAEPRRRSTVRRRELAALYEPRGVDARTAAELRGLDDGAGLRILVRGPVHQRRGGACARGRAVRRPQPDGCGIGRSRGRPRRAASDDPRIHAGRRVRPLPRRSRNDAVPHAARRHARQRRTDRRRLPGPREPYAGRHGALRRGGAGGADRTDEVHRPRRPPMDRYRPGQLYGRQRRADALPRRNGAGRIHESRRRQRMAAGDAPCSDRRSARARRRAVDARLAGQLPDDSDQPQSPSHLHPRQPVSRDRRRHAGAAPDWRTGQLHRSHGREPGLRGMPRHDRPDGRRIPELGREQPLPALQVGGRQGHRAAGELPLVQLSEERRRPAVLHGRR